MVYIFLMNEFFQKDMEHSFNPLETALFTRLVNHNNRLFWKPSFNLSVEKMMAELKLKTKKPFDTARKRLCDADLITIKNGNGRGSTTSYTLVGLRSAVERSTQRGNKNPSLSGGVSVQFEDGLGKVAGKLRDGTGTVSGLVHKTKTETRQNQTGPDKIEANASSASDDSLSSPTERWRAEKKEALDSFEKFWNAYDKKEGRKKSLKLWNTITEAERLAVLEHVPAYVSVKRDKQFRKRPENYLEGQCWLDEISPVFSRSTSSGEPSATEIQMMLVDGQSARPKPYAAQRRRMMDGPPSFDGPSEEDLRNM